MGVVILLDAKGFSLVSPLVGLDLFFVLRVALVYGIRSLVGRNLNVLMTLHFIHRLNLVSESCRGSLFVWECTGSRRLGCHW